jgi:uncharacterized Zn finger protein
MSYFYGGWPAYVPVAQRKAKAKRKLESLQKKGRICLPVEIAGRAIATTFWGKKWCDNLENYSDYESRLPRGRSYVRNGAVIDLQISAGKITALVAGSEVYEVSITIRALEQDLWNAILGECAGKVASLVELLQGRLSSAVMEIVTRPERGLFPGPRHISFRCSCPDGAYMCKHVAAVLYGVGARFDRQPDLLFLLRHVDPEELIWRAGTVSIPEAPLGEHRQLETTDLSALFGIELDSPAVTAQDKPMPDGPVLDKPVSKALSPKSQPESKNKARAPPPMRSRTVTAPELIARGIPPHIRQSWLTSGILLHTGERGVYRATRQTEPRIAAYLSRRAEGQRRAGKPKAG